MKWSMTTVGIIILGLIGVAIIILFQNLTTSSENDYYLLKEITEAAMFDSIDISYYRETGDLKIAREKFVENFTRRYAESTLFIGGRYIISFYDIIEVPPKVSILINTDIIDYQIYDVNTKDNYSVFNNLSGILEYATDIDKNDNVYMDKSLEKAYYYNALINNDGSFIIDEPINIPREIVHGFINFDSIKVSFNGYRVSNNVGDILKERLRKGFDWMKYSDNNAFDNIYDSINIDDFTSDCSFNNIYYYNCITNNGTGNKTSSINCNDYNTIWFHIDGNCKYGSRLLLIIDTNFKYKEYKY